MTKPAKDEPALLKRAGEAIRKALIKPPGCTESTGCAVGPCHCAHLAAEASIAAIRAAGWTVVPQTELDALRAENARLRGALEETCNALEAATAFHYANGGFPFKSSKQTLKQARAALEVKP
jgi:hypothetical protein